VVHALERLQGLGDDKAGQYLASITRFVFVKALVVSEHILQSTVFLSKFLQGIECDLLEATKEGKAVIELLRAERLDESVWNELYQSALDLSEPFDIVENMPRRCGRQTTRANHPADTAKQYWKVSLYYAFIDHMIMELESRLIKSNSSQTDSSSRSARSNSMTVLHSFVASSRSHSIHCRNFDRNTVLCKMCSDTTRAITNTNLVIDARY
jgi:hypothetical protein